MFIQIMKFYIPVIFAVIIISVMLTAILNSKPENNIEIVSGNIRTTNKPATSSSYSISEASKNSSESSRSQSQTSSPTVNYTLKLSNGKLYIYSSVETEPISSYTISEKMLPSADREQLYIGITVANQSELQKLIEDYTS